MLIKDNIVIRKRDTLEFGRFSNKTKQNLIVPYYAYNFGDISTNVQLNLLPRFKFKEPKDYFSN